MKLYHEKIANLNSKPEFSDALLSYSKLCCVQIGKDLMKY